MIKENIPPYTVTEKKGSKVANVVAPIVLMVAFVFGVGYTTFALMGAL